MYLRFAHVCAIYSTPKAVCLTLEFSCVCGREKQHTITCYRYGRIFVECITCCKRQLLELNQKTILMFFTLHAPTRVSAVTSFLDLWEQEMS